MGNILKEKNYSILNVYIGAEIQKLRLNLGLTQLEFANKIGTSRANLVNQENGVQSPPLIRLYKICEVFDINLTDLIPDIEWYSENKNKKLVKTVSIRIVG